MPFLMVRNDITKMKVDAIVNAANSSLLGGGGVDGAIHRAAGPQLLEECRTLNGCQTGSAKLTKGYNLPAEYVIHTVGPIWNGGSYGEKQLLQSCYRKSLALAKEYGCESVAFPLISAGAYGYPKAEALKTAVEVITDFLLENDMTVYMTIFDRESFAVSEKLMADIRSFIDDRYVEEHTDSKEETRRRTAAGSLFDKLKPAFAEDEDEFYDIDVCAALSAAKDISEKTASFDAEDSAYLDDVVKILRKNQTSQSASLKDYLEDIDESFSECLLRLITEKGMTDSQCYKKANIDRKLFSKIKNDRLYKPSKPTAIAFAIALELSLTETEDLLKKAGFALSHSSKADIIIEYFILKGNYNIFDINDALFEFDQPLLGC